MYLLPPLTFRICTHMYTRTLDLMERSYLYSWKTSIITNQEFVTLGPTCIHNIADTRLVKGDSLKLSFIFI